MSNSGQGRDRTPNGNANREVYGGFPNTIEEYIPFPRGAEVSRRSKPDQKEKGYEGTW
jgi:hypothetical protein